MERPAAPTTRAGLAALLEHTLLRPEATDADVVTAVGEAVALDVVGVCVAAARAPAARDALDALGPAGQGRPRLVTVVGFPSGAHRLAAKAHEAALAVAGGAQEVDLVVDLGAVAAGRFGAVADELAAVRAAVDEAVAGADRVLVKAIVESALWDDDRLAAACRAACEGGADLVKTSTGFHPAGGATPHAVRLMASVVRPLGRGVKASGGIRTTDQARALVAAGARRLGTSATAGLLAGLPLNPSGRPSDG